MSEIERHDFDVVVIGAGGAGLRAAIEADPGVQSVSPPQPKGTDWR